MQTIDGSSSTLLNRVLRGEAGAWDRFAAIYVPLVFRWIRSAGLNENDAGDVCQNVFLSVVKDLPKFRKDEPGHSLQGWLRVVTRHATVNWFRQRQKQVGEPGYSLEDVEASLSVATDDSQQADRQLLFARVTEIVREDFDPATWEMFQEMELGGKSAQEVAAARGVTVWTVYKARSRIVARLREALEI